MHILANPPPKVVHAFQLPATVANDTSIDAWLTLGVLMFLFFILLLISCLIVP